MKNNLNNLFAVDEELNLDFNFNKMFTEGYKITPSKSKWVIYPFLILMLVITLFGLGGDIYHFIDTGYGFGFFSILRAILMLGICITIYVGTAHYWFKINQKGKLNNSFSKDLRKEYPQFKYRASARKELYDRILFVLMSKYFIPRIKFEYTYQTETIDLSIADVTRTVSDNLSTGANYQEQFTAIFITIKGIDEDDVKLLKTEEVLAWLNENQTFQLDKLSGYKLNLRVKQNHIIIEFENEITNPENKLKLLNYVKQQVVKTIKKEPKSINLEEVRRLYNSEQEIGIKHCFKLFEAAQWDLGEIITYVKDNFSKEKYSLDLDTMLDERFFILGPVILTYYVYQDAAQGVEDTDYFYLNFYVDFEKKENIFIRHDIEEKSIATAELVRLYFEESDIPKFTAQMDKHFSEHIQQLDLAIKENVYEYLQQFYTALVNNKEI